MSNQSWNSVLQLLSKAGLILSNSTAVGNLLVDRSSVPIPGGTIQLGSVLRITGCGQISNITTTPGTLTLNFTLNSANVWTCGPMQLSSTAHTNVPIYFDVLMIAYTTGQNQNANFMGQGRATSQALSLTATADSANTPATLLMPNTAPAVGAGFDSTISNIINFTGQFSVANAGNSLQLFQYVLESMN